MNVATTADEVLGQCKVRRAFDKAPHAPIAGTPTASVSNEKLQADLLFPGDLIALRAMDVFSKYSLLIPVRSEGPPEVWDFISDSRIGVSGQPQSIRTDEGEEGQNKL